MADKYETTKLGIAMAEVEASRGHIARLKAFAAKLERGPGAREVALAITNAQQVLHWLNDAVEIIDAQR